MPLLRLIAIFLVLSVSGVQGALAQDGELARFFRHDEASSKSFRYQELDLILDKTVIFSGPSERFMLRERKDTTTGSNLGGGSRSKTWLEGNRVVFNAFNRDGLNQITLVRQTIEALPHNYPIETWNRDEQLTFWLNLYTIGVYEVVARAYPIQKLRRLREGKGSKPGAWDEKMFTVAGVPLSLNDIQFRIVMPQWKDPRVLYGFYQGTIGGPSIQSRAFMGRNVWLMLDRIGLDFVNSIRGVHKRGKTAKASMIYQWGAELFPDFETDLRAHLASYADDKTKEILNKTRKVDAGFYDWVIADLHRGIPQNQGSGMLSYGSRLFAFSGQEEEGAISNGATPGEISTVLGPEAAANGALTPLTTSPDAQMPEHTMRYLRGLRAKFEVYGPPNTRVDIIDIDRERGKNSESIPVETKDKSPSA